MPPAMENLSELSELSKWSAAAISPRGKASQGPAIKAVGGRSQAGPF